MSSLCSNSGSSNSHVRQFDELPHEARDESDNSRLDALIALWEICHSESSCTVTSKNKMVDWSHPFREWRLITFNVCRRERCFAKQEEIANRKISRACIDSRRYYFYKIMTSSRDCCDSCEKNDRCLWHSRCHCRNARPYYRTQITRSKWPLPLTLGTKRVPETNATHAFAVCQERKTQV